MAPLSFYFLRCRASGFPLRELVESFLTGVVSLSTFLTTLPFSVFLVDDFSADLVTLFNLHIFSISRRCSNKLMYRQADDLTGWCTERYVGFYTTQHSDLSEIAYALRFPSLSEFVQTCPYRQRTDNRYVRTVYTERTSLDKFGQS